MHVWVPALLTVCSHVAGFPNASQEDLKIEKTAKDTQKGLEKSFQNITPDTSDLPNPFEGVGTGAGSIADKVCINLACVSMSTYLEPFCFSSGVVRCMDPVQAYALSWH